MSEAVISTGFIDVLKVFFVAILIYVIIFSLLKKIKIFGEDTKVNSLIALITAIIVSFSGAVTYAVMYAVNWFIMILFIVLLILIILLFLGVKPSDISDIASGNSRAIMIAGFVLFSIILVKGFFALNNAYDINDPQANQYDVDTSFNTGVDDITNKEINPGFFDRLTNSENSDLFSVVLFLIILGVFVLLIGK